MNYLIFLGMFSCMVFIGTCDAQPADSEGYNQKDVLEYIVREPIHATNTAPVLILLHGYGSNEKDLFP